MENLIVVNPDTLMGMMAEMIDEKLQEFLKLFNSKQNNDEKTFTRKQTAEYLGISLSTLYNWTRDNKIKSHYIGDKVYYKMSEIEKALKPIN